MLEDKVEETDLKIVSIPFISGQCWNTSQASNRKIDKSVSIPFISGQCWNTQAVEIDSKIVSVSIPFISGQCWNFIVS